jgi:hypothetical protein
VLKEKQFYRNCIFYEMIFRSTGLDPNETSFRKELRKVQIGPRRWRAGIGKKLDWGGTNEV